MTNFGGVDVVPLLGAIAGCHCRVPEERVTTNFGGVDVVPLLGAILGCHCSVLWFLLYIDDTKNCFLLSGVYAGIICSHLLLVQPRVDWHPANFGMERDSDKRISLEKARKQPPATKQYDNFFHCLIGFSILKFNNLPRKNNSNSAPESECLKDEISSWDGLFLEVFAARVGECIPTESFRMPAMHWTNFFATPLAWNLGY